MGVAGWVLTMKVLDHNANNALLIGSSDCCAYKIFTFLTQLVGPSSLIQRYPIEILTFPGGFI